MTFEIANNLISALLSGEQNSFILLGEGGIGKTLLTLNKIKESLEESEYNYFNGYSTPLSLFEFLYTHRDQKLIILDDIEGVFNNQTSISILKASLWANHNNKRVVQYHTNSTLLDVPHIFEITSKIIILCNHIPNTKNMNTQALLSRCINYELCFSYQEKLNICNHFVENNIDLTQPERLLIMDILYLHTYEFTHNFNFRTLQKLISFVKYDVFKTESLFCATVETDEDKKVFILALGKFPIIQDQVSYFLENTGKSRRTFFRLKKQYKKEVK